MRNLLNRYRIIFHCIIGCAFAHFWITLFFKQNYVSSTSGATFGDWIDHNIQFFFIAAFGVLLSGLANFGIEEYQAKTRKTNTGYGFVTILRAGLIGGIPAGIIWIFTKADSNDLASMIIDSVIIMVIAVYYFWDLKKRKA